MDAGGRGGGVDFTLLSLELGIVLVSFNRCGGGGLGGAAGGGLVEVANAQRGKASGFFFFFFP